MKEVTCLVPLYRSSRYLDLVCRTIDDHVEHGATVLLSDQHLLDDAVDVLRHRYRSESRVEVFAADGGGNWIENVNLLIANVATTTFRVIPHDDSVPAESTRLLLAALDAAPDAVLCHGHVHAEDMDGTRIPARDEPNIPLVPQGCSRAFGTSFSLGLFWDGYFNGAFKALMRTEPIHSRSMYIRKTPTLIHSERAWLFGLSLLGEFLFVPSASMTKRYWRGSLSDRWSWGSPEIVDVAKCMATYVDDLVDDDTLQRRMRFNVFLNAMNWSRWLDGITAARPPFDPLLPEVPPRPQLARFRPGGL